MTKAKGVDKNLGNVVDQLEQSAVTSHSAQQMRQKANARRHRDVNHHHKETDMDPSH